jgi:hypothetical protein
MDIAFLKASLVSSPAWDAHFMNTAGRELFNLGSDTAEPVTWWVLVITERWLAIRSQGAAANA